METRCKMCGRHFRRRDDALDRWMIEHETECVACKARTLYFADCLRNEDLIESLRYMAV